MNLSVKKIAVLLVACLLAVLLAREIIVRVNAPEAADGRRGGRPAPVEVAAIRHEPIELRRTFSGTLEPRADFIVSPEVSGRVEAVMVDLGDTVKRGQIVVRLDDDTFVQNVAQAEAEVAVAQANLAEAQSAFEIAGRELERVSTLRTRGVASDAEFDTAKTNQLAAQAKVAVAEAQLNRARAAMQAQKIARDNTTITAEWTEGDGERAVAERFVDEGQNVAPNTPLLRIVEITPITGVFFVTAKDYGRLAIDQPVEVTTDAFPKEVFTGKITRIAPVFKEASREARIELVLENKQLRLKPGMFIRATVRLARVENALVVPDSAITRRDDIDGVFVVSADGKTVSWRPVDVGIRQDHRVQISGEGLQGNVVTLGQQLIDDGSAIVVPEVVPSASKNADAKTPGQGL